eukprot:jgi/Ulvmu1/8169/UM040_0066.1
MPLLQEAVIQMSGTSAGMTGGSGPCTARRHLTMATASAVSACNFRLSFGLSPQRQAGMPGISLAHISHQPAATPSSSINPTAGRQRHARRPSRRKNTTASISNQSAAQFSYEPVDSKQPPALLRAVQRGASVLQKATSSTASNALAVPLSVKPAAVAAVCAFAGPILGGLGQIKKTTTAAAGHAWSQGMNMIVSAPPAVASSYGRLLHSVQIRL